MPGDPATPEELHIGSDGLWLPNHLRDFTAQIVFRTPRATIQHFASGGGSLDGYYGIIDETHFGDPDDLSNVQNPELAPNRVSIKPQGEPVETYPVEVNPDVRCDGGPHSDAHSRVPQEDTS